MKPLFAAVLLCLSVAACGSTDDAAAPATTVAPSTTLSTAVPADETTNTSAPTTTEASTTSLVEEPSQSAADAARDGVVAELAALPVSLRVDARMTVPAEEGLWVLSQPRPEVIEMAPDCGLGDPAGLYGRDIICTAEYGEVLLMDVADGRILRAYPLPALPPNHLVLTEDAVYCGRYGDGALPDSMICRIDRETLDWIIRVFPWETDSAVGGLYIPENWTINDPIDAAYVETMGITKDGLIVEGWGGEKLVDPLTLELQDAP